MKQYRLLRSNKESGPYTADELIGLGLKPYDLVWMDGKSAAWRYPSEMQEFKSLVPAVEEQPFDRFLKKQGIAKVDSQAITQPVAETATVVAPAPKPRIRIKADWTRVEQPVVIAAVQAAAPPQPKPQQPAKSSITNNTVNAPSNTVNNTSWQNSWLDWQQEQNAVKNASNTDTAQAIEKPQAVNAATAEYMAPEIETKFSESLDSLKQRYADTVLKAKGKATEWYKLKGVAAIALLAIPVLGFGIWLGGGMHNQVKEVTKPIVAAVPAVTGVPETQPTPADENNTAGVGVQGNTAKNDGAALTKPNPNSKELVPSFDDNKPTASVAATKPVKKAVVKQMPPPTTVGGKKYGKVISQQKAVTAQPQQKYIFTLPINTDPSARNKVINQALAGAAVNNGVANQVVQNRQQAMPQQYAAPKKETQNTNPVFAHYTKQQRVEDYVSVEADQPYQQAIQNLALNVENVTDATVDLVVIDVQYYDQRGKFKTGQTIYVKNIPVNETVRAKIPDNTNASRIKYRVSLVSVEQKGVYLVAE